MVISTLIDIEVVFRKNTNIKKKIMIDSKNININILNRKILEVCEIFPKLSGLNRLSPKNLMKKTENGEVSIKEEVNFLKSKDVILFDLSFYEIWLDIQMTLKCDDIIVKKIKFELKVTLDKEKNYLDNILIKLGFKYFDIINDNDDFYIFNDLMIENFNSGLIEGNKLNFNFENDELKCTLIFVNFTDYIYKLLIKENFKIHSSNMKDSIQSEKINRKETMKKYFNDYFNSYFLKEKTDDIAKFNRIIFTYNTKDSIILLDDLNSSMIIDRNSFFILNSDNKNNNLFSNGSFASNFQQNRTSFKYPLSEYNDFFLNEKKEYFTNKKNNNEKYNKYKKDIEFLKEIENDYFIMIRKLSKYSLSNGNIDFFKLPDTKNLVEINNNQEETFEIQNNYIHHISIFDFNERLFLLRKLKDLGIFLFIVLIIIFIYYNLFSK